MIDQKTLNQNRDVVRVFPGKITWGQIRQKENIRLYAGQVPKFKEYEGLIGLSIDREDHIHIRHDIRQALPLADNCLESYQAEDVIEHIPYGELVPIIDEIYRALKPGKTFRLSIPDYGCDILYERSVKNERGEIVSDPGSYDKDENFGHKWFPRLDSLVNLLVKTKFSEFGSMDFLHYYNMDGTFGVRPIDYSKGMVRRTPDHDERVQTPYRPMSLVVDLIKGS